MFAGVYQPGKFYSCELSTHTLLPIFLSVSPVFFIIAGNKLLGICWVSLMVTFIAF